MAGATLNRPAAATAADLVEALRPARGVRDTGAQAAAARSCFAPCRQLSELCGTELYPQSSQRSWESVPSRVHRSGLLENNRGRQSLLGIAGSLNLGADHKTHTIEPASAEPKTCSVAPFRKQGRNHRGSRRDVALWFCAQPASVFWRMERSRVRVLSDIVSKRALRSITSATRHG
jgi:hypothetical protein